MVSVDHDNSEVVPPKQPQYEPLDLFVRRFMGVKDGSSIQNKLGQNAWRAMVGHFKMMQLVYILTHGLFVGGGLAFVLLTTSVFIPLSISEHSLLFASLLLLPSVLLHSTRQEKRREEIEATANDQTRNNVERLFRLHRSIAEGRLTVLESQREITAENPARVPRSYFTEDHGVVRLLRSELKWAFLKIGHWKRFTDEMVVEFTADLSIHAELIMVELCTDQRKRLSLSKDELKLIEVDLKSKRLWTRVSANALEVLDHAVTRKAEGKLMKVLIGEISDKLKIIATSGNKKGEQVDKTPYIRTVLEGRAAGKQDAFGKQLQKAINYTED